MSFVNSVLGSAIGASLANAVNELITKHGGIKGLAEQFEQSGYGRQVRSWIGTGENQPIGADAVQKTLGQDTVTQMASKLGIPPEELSAKLAEYLPAAVDKATPNGQLPSEAGKGERAQ